MAASRGLLNKRQLQHRAFEMNICYFDPAYNRSEMDVTLVLISLSGALYDSKNGIDNLSETE